MTQPTDLTGDFVTFRIDGRLVRARKGSFVLQAARDAGIEIPTLCHHEDLQPAGMCRLCMVEVTHPDWSGWADIVTACLYPVRQDIEVSTCSDKVHRTRAGVVRLLLARCPNSKKIQALAKQYGVTTDELEVDLDADNCIMCGLCTRVCETYATSAIVTAGTGVRKRITTFADAPAAECIGCGACANVCPTGACQGQRTSTDFRIWGRVFATKVCEVDPSRCIACSSCEQACPFDVARVMWRAGEQPVATIAPYACTGCGACVGACPTGAILQPQQSFPEQDLAEGHVDPTFAYVFACARSGLFAATTHERTDLQSIRDQHGCDEHSDKHTGEHSGEPHSSHCIFGYGASSSLLQEPKVRVLELSCTARVTVTGLLRLIASGCPGVLVLGRHQSTCRLDGAEDVALRSVQTVQQILDFLGMDPGRVRFQDPAAGVDGPIEAVREFTSFLAALSPNRLNITLTPGSAQSSVAIENTLESAINSPTSRVVQYEGLDSCLALIARMRRDLKAGQREAERTFRRFGLALPKPGGAVLFAGIIPQLQMLGQSMFAPVSLQGLLKDAIFVLQKLGVPDVGVQLGASGIGSLSVFPSVSDGATLSAELPAKRLENEPEPVSSERCFSLYRVSGATLVDDVLRQRGRELVHACAPMRVATDGTSEQIALVNALGYEAVDVGKDPLPACFSITYAQRQAAMQRLQQAQDKGAQVLLVNDPQEFARYVLLTAPSAWRTTVVVPLLGVQLAKLVITGRTLQANPFFRAQRGAAEVVL